MDESIRFTALSLQPRVAQAVRIFWDTRQKQARRQGAKSGVQDQGARRAVTGGAHLDGFIQLIRELLVLGGLPRAAVLAKKGLELPGYFRPEKKWDLLVVHDRALLATIEFKAQVGPSFGNNFNNRSEEAIGNATDYWTAYREGAFAGSPRPWLGYVMMLEETEKSTTPVRVKEPHFSVFDVFRDTSYAERYELLLLRLHRERLYDGTWFLMSCRDAADTGEYDEPNPELGFTSFATDLLARVLSYSATRGI